LPIPSSPPWPPFRLSGETPLRGAALFRARRSNVVNCVPGPETAWKPNYPGSDIFSWTDKNKGVAVDIVIVGQLRFFSLATATSQFKDPTYRLELDMDQGTASALRRLLETGPLRNTDGARFPPFAGLSVNHCCFKSIVETDKPELDASDGRQRSLPLPLGRERHGPR
jgi:hypothetical protein